jgi:hypothetical protein
MSVTKRSHSICHRLMRQRMVSHSERALFRVAATGHFGLHLKASQLATDMKR